MAASAAPRFICFLCKRKFQSAALLQRHKQLSDLHRKNLQRQEEDINKKKEELRQAILGVRRQIHDVEASIARKALSDDEAQGQRTTLELKLRQAVGEYGQVQEKLEMSRHQQVSERGNSSTFLKLSETHETHVGRLQVSVGAATWQGNKEVQEDRYMMNVQLEAPGGQRIIGFCVLDGHSGSLCVDALMDWLPRNLQKCLAAKPSLTEETLRQAVTEACVLTDDEFLAKAREREVLDGSTMIICLIYQDEGRLAADGTRGRGPCRLLLANLGDSRAVLCRSQGGRLSAVRLTDDHKPGRADERRRIEAKGGVVDMQGVWRVFTPGPANFGGRSVLWGLAVSRAFGDLLMKEPQRYGCATATGELVSAVPEIHTYELHPTEDRFVVLACDGIWDVLADDDAIAVCIEHRTADLAANALVRRAFEVGSDDNLTALVVAWQQTDAEAGPAPQLDGADAKRARVD
uniref:PPM-type phosphatase domain-containing protein n=1 Tax=Zooxanthella nutricula TaxID=1333877 RepID=A0A6U6SV67_9DINO|mmetsp:Transcript_76528/g.234243  ORF Transcript_76528/g.234243 Transcript_76528/m.234243 type:complete len:462 (+) Transcript_76528:141-1526(+)